MLQYQLLHEQVLAELLASCRLWPQQSLQGISVCAKLARFLQSSCRYSYYTICMLQFLGRCDYSVKVQVHSYRNPTGRCADERCMCRIDRLDTFRCCDNSATACSIICENRLRCDNIFTYCLMRSNATTVPPDNSVCTDEAHRQRTTAVNWNDGDIDFSNVNDTVLGLQNGFRLTGLDATWEVKLSSIASPSLT